MEGLDGSLQTLAHDTNGMVMPHARTETPMLNTRIKVAEAAQPTAEAEAARAAAQVEKRRWQLEQTMGWACESCMTIDNRSEDPRCRVCLAWRSEKHRQAFQAEAARREAEHVAQAQRLAEEREAEEAERLAQFKAQLGMTRDERVAAMLGQLANRKMYACWSCWTQLVDAARVERQAEAMHAAHYRLGKRCVVATEEKIRRVLHDRYVQLNPGTQLDPESLLATWRSKTATYVALCGKQGVIVAVSAEERAVELQFAANLHQTSDEASAFWLPIEVCFVDGVETAQIVTGGGPRAGSATAKGQSSEPEPETQQDSLYVRGAEQDEQSWAKQKKVIEMQQLAAATIIQAHCRRFLTRKRYGPELQRTRGWTAHDHLMETINRLERGTRTNFNLQFPNARGDSQVDPTAAVVREEWQAAIGNGPHWSTKMITYHIAEALDDDLKLYLSGDTIYPDGIVRRRISPEDAERLLSAVRVEARRRQRLGTAGSRAIAALTTHVEPKDPSSVKAATTINLVDGEYEERHLVETVKQCIDDIIIQVELLDNPNVTRDRAMDHWSRTRVVADRLAAAASAAEMLNHQAWFQPDAVRWLASLTLDKLRLTDLGAEVIAAQMPKSNLHTLVLHECGFSSEGVLAIGSVLYRCPSLHLLDLRGNAALNAGLRAVAAGATHPGCGMRSAFLTFNMNAKQWSSRGLEDAIRCLNASIPHSRLTALKLDFRYQVISHRRPFRQQKKLKLHAIDFTQRQSTPLPEWLQVEGSSSPKHAVTDEMRTRLWANLRRSSHAARQRLAWAVVAEQVPLLTALGRALHERLRLAVSERTRRDASTVATGGVTGQVAAGQYIPLAHHYITRRKVLAREGIEADSRPLRFLEEGEIVAGLEVKCDRRSGGEPRLRFIYALPPMLGVQGWAPLSESLPPGPTKSEAEAAAAEAREAERTHRANTEASIKAEEQRWRRQIVQLEQDIEVARSLPLGDEMLAALLKAEKAMLAANKKHTAVIAALETELASISPKPALPSHRSWQMGQLEEQHSGGDATAIRRALNIEGDLLTPLAGCQPVPGDGRELVRQQRRRQRQLVNTTGLAEAMVAHRNSLPPKDYSMTQPDFLFVVAADGHWPVKTARRVHLMSYTEDTEVKFHSRLRIVAAICSSVERRSNPSQAVYLPQAGKRQEALFAEAPRWQRLSSVQDLSKWLLDKSGLFWPASWACVRVADVLSVVEAEGELAEQRQALSNLRTELTQLCDSSAELNTQLVKAVETLEAVGHAHDLASIEAKYYDGKKLDGTQDEGSPTTVLVTATQKLRAAEEERARNQCTRLRQDHDSAVSSAATIEKEIARRENRIQVLEQGLEQGAISDSLELDWNNTLMECHADEKPSSLADRWAQEERDEEEGDDCNSAQGDVDRQTFDDSASQIAQDAALQLNQDQNFTLADVKAGHEVRCDNKSEQNHNRQSTGRRKTTGKSMYVAGTSFPGQGGLLGESLALRASRLDARLPALQRHTELLPLPISSQHVHHSKPPFGAPGGDQPRHRRLSASPSRLLAPLQDVPATPARVATDGNGESVPIELASDQPVRKHHIMSSSPLFGRG